MNFYLSSSIMPVPQAGAAPGKFDLARDIVFKAPGGGSFTTSDPQTAVLMLEIAACGNRPTFAGDIAVRAQKYPAFGTGKTARELLIQNGMLLALHGHINLHLAGAHYTREVSEKPVAYPLARLQAGVRNCRTVTNVLSAYIETNEISGFVLRHLDGTKTVPEVAGLLLQSIQRGEIGMVKEISAEDDLQKAGAAVTEMVRNIVSGLVRQGLIVS